jgi:hypothetical protein
MIRHVLMVAAFAGASVGCAHLDDEPWRPSPPISTSTTPGRLSVKTLPEGPQGAPTDADVGSAARQRTWGAPLQIVAEAAPLCLLAARLSEALHVTVMTELLVADLRASVAADSITLREQAAANLDWTPGP